jgi:hypothetical protein
LLANRAKRKQSESKFMLSVYFPNIFRINSQLSIRKITGKQMKRMLSGQQIPFLWFFPLDTTMEGNSVED